jgi:site-specific DNA-cytosine methylase
MTETIDYGSVCSGIEAATAAWESLGMLAAWFAEIEPFPSAVLADHYPHAHLHQRAHDGPAKAEAAADDVQLL